MGVASIPGTEPPADRGTVLAGRICGPTFEPASAESPEERSP